MRRYPIRQYRYHHHFLKQSTFLSLSIVSYYSKHSPNLSFPPCSTSTRRLVEHQTSLSNEQTDGIVPNHWLQMPVLKTWLLSKNGQAYCRFCCRFISGGINHMYRHGETKKHMKLYNTAVQQQEENL